MELLSPPVPQLAVAVADGQRLFAEGLGRALRAQADLDVSDECATTGRAILRCVARRKPDVALIDFWIADMAGPAAARAIRNISPSTRVLFLTEFLIGPVQRAQARAAGALWFLRKDLALDEIVAAIRAAALTPVPPEHHEADAQAADRVRRLMTLSVREIEVLQVLRRGLSPQEAAAEFSISSGTVKNHIHSILVKTNTRNQLEALLLAEGEGWISGD